MKLCFDFLPIIYSFVKLRMEDVEHYFFMSVCVSVCVCVSLCVCVCANLFAHVNARAHHMLVCAFVVLHLCVCMLMCVCVWYSDNSNCAETLQQHPR